MWQATFCPTFSPISFTFIIWFVTTLFYMGELFCCIFMEKYELNDNVFLGPDPDLLVRWGCIDRIKIHDEYQYWRLFTSLLLTSGFMYYGINTVILLIMGFIVENRKMSIPKMAILYFGSGIMANLFTICCESSFSVGNAGAISALMWALLASVIINWAQLKKIMRGMFPVILILNCVLFFVFLLMFSFSNDLAPGFKQQSMVAIAGGIFSGLSFGMMLAP